MIGWVTDQMRRVAEREGHLTPEQVRDEVAAGRMVIPANINHLKHQLDPMAIGRAIKTADRDIVYVAPFGSEMEKAAQRLDLRLAREGFADRQYDDGGTLTSRSIPGSVLKDPAAAAAQVLRMVLDGEIVSRTGKLIKANVHTICVHGDEATGVAVARGVRDALEKAGVAIVPLTEMKL